jgi:hypothetical protein
MKTIKLINSKQGWLARFENDTEIMALFGTDTIPTSFTEQASPMMVKREIEVRNPGYNVVFA